MNLSAPLTPEELQQLDALMEAQGGMRLVRLHGYLTAVISGPDYVPPEDWMPWIWDGNRSVMTHPQFSLSMESICRLYNSIGSQLMTGGLFFPLQAYEKVPPDHVLVNNVALARWCGGYMEGMEFTEEIWLLPEYSEMQILIFLILAASNDDENVKKCLAPGWRDANLEDIRPYSLKELPSAIPVLDGYWRLMRKRQGYVEITHNSSCPCGSEKMYKDCCRQTT